MPPKVLTDADFIETAGYMVPRSVEAETCLLIVAHSNLCGTEPAGDQSDSLGARDFLEMILASTHEFTEIRVGLLNYNDAPAAIRRLPIFFAEPLLFAEALIWRANFLISFQALGCGGKI